MEEITIYFSLFNERDNNIPQNAILIDTKLLACGPEAKMESDYISAKIDLAILSGLNYVTIPKDYYLKVVDSRKKIDAFNQLLSKTAELNNLGISLEKQGKIDEAIKVYEDNIALGGKALHSFDRLIILYNKAKDFDNEKRVIFRAREVYNSEAMYDKRLSKLTDTYVKPQSILPITANPITVKPNSLGKQYEYIKRLFPEFDFYTNSNGDEFQNSPHKNDIWSIHSYFGLKIADAAKYEEDGDFNKATLIYEDLVSDEYFLTKPYDRLIKIYCKAKLKTDERRMLDYSISFFKQFRDKQKEYVLMLARKYNKEDYVIDCINNNKKIFYYGGSFELYNPNTKTILDWEKRLLKFK